MRQDGWICLYVSNYAILSVSSSFYNEIEGIEFVDNKFLFQLLALGFKLYKLFLQKLLNYCYYCYFLIIDFSIMLNLFKIKRKIFLLWWFHFSRIMIKVYIHSLIINFILILTLQNIRVLNTYLIQEDFFILKISKIYSTQIIKKKKLIVTSKKNTSNCVSFKQWPSKSRTNNEKKNLIVHSYKGYIPIKEVLSNWNYCTKDDHYEIRKATKKKKEKKIPTISSMSSYFFFSLFLLFLYISIEFKVISMVKLKRKYQ